MNIAPKISKKQDLRTVPAPSITLCLLVVVQGIIKADCNVICSPQWISFCLGAIASDGNCSWPSPRLTPLENEMNIGVVPNEVHPDPGVSWSPYLLLHSHKEKILSWSRFLSPPLRDLTPSTSHCSGLRGWAEKNKYIAGQQPGQDGSYQ